MRGDLKKKSKFVSAAVVVIALVGAWLFKEKLLEEKKISEAEVLKVAQATTGQGCILNFDGFGVCASACGCSGSGCC